MPSFLQRMSALVCFVVFLFGCSKRETENVATEAPPSISPTDSVVDLVAESFSNAPEQSTSEVESPAQEALVMPVSSPPRVEQPKQPEPDQPETKSDQAGMSLDTSADEPSEDASASSVQAVPKNKPMVDNDSLLIFKPVLTRDGAEEFALLGDDYMTEDKETFQELAELDSTFSFERTPEDVYQFIVAAVKALDDREVDYLYDHRLPIPVDMKVGRPMWSHREVGYALPSMRLALLKYLIDRSKEEDNFDVKQWLSRTQEIEKKLILTTETAFRKPEFEKYLTAMESAADLWDYANIRLGSNFRQLRYGYTVSPTGAVSLGFFSGISGLSRRAGKIAGTMVVLKQLEDARVDYERSKLNLEHLVGAAVDDALTEEERTHLEDLWAANVLLSPNQFFRIRWQSQFKTDQQLKELHKQLNEAGKDAKAEQYVARARLYAKKGNQPYMVYLDLLEAGERDPNLQLAPDLEGILKRVGEELQIEDKEYRPQAMLKLYCNALIVTQDEVDR